MDHNGFDQVPLSAHDFHPMYALSQVIVLMGINPADFRQLIIRPTLQKLGKWSPSLENLLIGTAAQASELGTQLISTNGGLGVYQVNAEIHQQAWDCYLAFDPDLASAVRGMASQRDFLCQPHLELTTNLSYATAIAWSVYAHARADIPMDCENIEGLARCWHLNFNQDPMLAPRHFVNTYLQLVKEEKAFAA